MNDNKRISIPKGEKEYNIETEYKNNSKKWTIKVSTILSSQWSLCMFRGQDQVETFSWV